MLRRAFVLMLVAPAPVRVSLRGEPGDVADGAAFGVNEARQTLKLLGRELIVGGGGTEVRWSPEGVFVDGLRVSATAEQRRAGRVEWDPALVAFGAAQLSERFAKAYARPMSAAAWCGWFAVKAAVEAQLRGVAVKDVAIDGHKGRKLRFVDGVLDQPLYGAPQ